MFNLLHSLVSSNIKVLVHDPLVSLQQLSILVSSPTPLTLWLFIIVNSIFVCIQLDFVLKHLMTVCAAQDFCWRMNLHFVVPQCSFILKNCMTNITRNRLDFVHILNMFFSGKNSTKWTNFPSMNFWFVLLPVSCNHNCITFFTQDLFVFIFWMRMIVSDVFLQIKNLFCTIRTNLNVSYDRDSVILQTQRNWI